MSEPSPALSFWQRFDRNTLTFFSISLVAGLVVLLGSTAVPLSMAIAAGLVIFCIGLWATAVVPDYWPAMALFLIGVTCELAPNEKIFSGFASSTFWLLFSGMVIGASFKFTGLGKRAAALLSMVMGRTYFSVIASIVFFGTAMTFVMPSTFGRILLLLPIVIALAEHLGYEERSNGQVGMVAAAAFGAFLPGFSVLPANAPNMVFSGMTETLYGLHFSYWSYLVLHFPVLGLLKATLLVVLISRFFPADNPQRIEQAQEKKPLSAAEKKLVTLIAICLVAWISDGVHGISPGWVGLAASLYCFWPNSGLTSPKCISEDINYGPLFFIVGVMGLGAIISATGLGGALVDLLSSQVGLSPDQPIQNVVSMIVMSTLIGMFTSLPGIPAVMTPLAANLAELTQLPLVTILMTQVLAFSNIFLPYQAPPLITAIQLGKLPHRAISKFCMVLFACTLGLLLPLDLVWWGVLGMFGG